MEPNSESGGDSSLQTETVEYEKEKHQLTSCPGNSCSSFVVDLSVH